MSQPKSKKTERRLYLSDDLLKKLEQIQEVTMSPTLTNVVAILVTRYGTDLINTWVVNSTNFEEENPAQECKNLDFSTPIDI